MYFFGEGTCLKPQRDQFPTMSSPFREVVVTLQVHLLPSRMENIKAGIDEQLSGYLMEYVGSNIF